MKISVNWLKDYISVKQTQEALADKLTMAGLEVKRIEKCGSDHILETEITTNRPDWLSHVGVAREIYALCSGKFLMPSAKRHALPLTQNQIMVMTPAPKLCPYYSAVLLEDVTWVETPRFMKERLEICGIRSINFIVDVTNFVLLELGQPLHAFDADRLIGQTIEARRAKVGEEMLAINGIEYKLTPDDLVICDGEGPVAIGGVMGGKRSEVCAGTKNILIESAFFVPLSIRSTARRLALTSESSYRFERGVDPSGVDFARERAMHLILQHAKVARVSRVLKSGLLSKRSQTIKFDPTSLNRVLGATIPLTHAKNILTRLGLQVNSSKKIWSVRAPSFRSDLTRSIDLVEEIARIYGYDQIPESFPSLVPAVSSGGEVFSLEHKLRELCSGMGFFEALTFSIIDRRPLIQLNREQPNWLTLVNPQNRDLNLMRPSLLPGLLETVRRNQSVGEHLVKLFEIGNQYLNQAKGRFSFEERVLGIILYGEQPSNWMTKNKPTSFFDVKGAVTNILNQLRVNFSEHPLKPNTYCASSQGIEIVSGEISLGYYGTIAKSVLRAYDLEQPIFYAELNLERLTRLDAKEITVRTLPKFPSIVRDLTVILPETVRSGEVETVIYELGKCLIKNVFVFDYFKGNKLPSQKKSLSFSIHYQAEDRTLQNEEINELHFSIVHALSERFGALLPSG